MTVNALAQKRRRTGLIAEKLGMTMSYKDGMRVPLTALLIHSTTVIASKNEASHGYNALQLATGERKLSRTHKSIKGHLAKAKVSSAKVIKEFRVSSDALLEIGATIGVNHFVEGQYIDVRGRSIGKGFAGAMKRHNFRGLEATHGVSVSHRSHGSTGSCQDPGRVIKGKKMAGHLGDINVCIQNLQIFSVDNENNILYVKGAVPGHKGVFLFIQDAVKKALPKGAPFPAANTNTAEVVKAEANSEELVVDAEIKPSVEAEVKQDQEGSQPNAENKDVEVNTETSPEVEENKDVEAQADTPKEE